MIARASILPGLANVRMKYKSFFFGDKNFLVNMCGSIPGLEFN